MLAHSPDLAQAVLAGSMFLDAAYEEVRKAKKLLGDAQVACDGRRKVARSKKVTVLPAKGREIDALANLPAAEQRSLAEAATWAEKVSARRSN